jgi:hypothetical protein
MFTSDRAYYYDGRPGIGNCTTNDGTSPATAFGSLQCAWDKLADKVDVAGHGLNFFNAAPASFVYTNGGLHTFRPIIGQGKTSDVRIDGGGATFNQTDGSYVFMGGDLETGEPAENVRFRIQNMRLTASSGGGVNANGSKIIIWQDVDFGAVTLAHMNAINPGGAIIADGDPILGAPYNRKQGYSISGDAAVHGGALAGGFLINHAVRIVIKAPVTLSAAFLQGGYPSGSVYSEFSEYVNPSYVTGKKFVVEMGGFLSTAGSVLVPGTIPGTVATSGVWQQ